MQHAVESAPRLKARMANTEANLKAQTEELSNSITALGDRLMKELQKSQA